jgi:hypothetical protein
MTLIDCIHRTKTLKEYGVEGEPLHTRVLSEVRNTSRWIDGVDGIDKKWMSELDVRRKETHESSAPPPPCFSSYSDL